MGFLEKASSQLFRRLNDITLKITANLHAHEVNLFRYRIFETDYKDKTKELIQVVTGVPCYIEFPSPIDLSENNFIYIEDLLPITALFPFKIGEVNLEVDLGDEFDFEMVDDLGNSATYRYQINNRSAVFARYSWYREFIVSPLRVDRFSVNSAQHTGWVFVPGEGVSTGHEITGHWETGVGPEAVVDPNIAIGGNKDEIKSLYDEYNQ